MASKGRRYSQHVESIFFPAEEFIKAKDNFKLGRNDSIVEENHTIEDVLFDMFKDSSGKLNVGKFLSALAGTGLRKTDPRLKEVMDKLKVILNEQQDVGVPESLILDKETFIRVISENIVLISKALKRDFVIADFKEFTKYIEEFFWSCKSITAGKVLSNIPQLAKFDPDYWGVSVCTVDGQRYSIGDTEIPFTLQSSGKPINYAIALSEFGSENVHKYVGQEPSGRSFNEILLDNDGKPHNPLVNPGAIIICSILLNCIKPDKRVSEKFEWVCNYFKKMTGGEYLNFNNATFLSQRETADRNFAIGYYLKENKCFPEKSVLKDVMDFYFQTSALEGNCDSVSVMAATLANGGICPITGERVITSNSVRDVLSLMHSCGMYDYSGKHAFRIGLPAKSGVSGCLMVVIPNVMGICCWSPPLDDYKNSVRGVAFCKELVSVYNFHQYDNLRHSPHKKDPRKQKREDKGLKIMNLLFSAADGDVSAIRKYYLSGMDMELSDYDGRTALHTAAAEGHMNCVEFLLKICKVSSDPKDRWGHTPIDNAVRFKRDKVKDYLQQWENTQRNDDTSGAKSPKLLITAY